MRRHTTKHHRKPRSLSGGDEKSNISKVPDKKHRAFHLLFSNLTVFKMAELLNKVWIDPQYQFIVVKRRR